MPEAVSLKNRGGRVVVVAVGDSINLYELMGMASEPTGSHLFLSTSFDSLFNLVVDTIGATCDGKCNILRCFLECRNVKPLQKNYCQPLVHLCAYITGFGNLTNLKAKTIIIM